MVTFAMPQGVIWSNAREVAAHIQREAVHRDPMAHADADRGDFALPDPDAGQTVASRGFDLVDREQLDEERLDPAQVTMQILAVTTEIDQKISDQLPRPVISRLAAAVVGKSGCGRCAASRRLDRSGVRPMV